MSELVKSFDVDPAAYEYAAAALRVLQAAFWNGRVLRDANGKPIQSIDQLMIAYQSGTWPVTDPLVKEGEPWREVPILTGEEAKRQYTAWQELLARREAAAILGEVGSEAA
jgi:hypothetical protein